MKRMNVVLKASAVAAVTGVLFYSVQSVHIHKRSVGSRLAEDLIRLVNFDVKEVDEDMIAKNFEENRKEHMIPEGIMRSEIDTFHESGMKVFRMRSGAEKGAQSVLYLHGGAYIHQPSLFHWLFLDRMVQETGMEFIVPIYPKAPEYTFENAYGAIAELYRNLLHERRDGLVFMGDSAGGGLAIGMAQWLKSEDLPMPKALIVISPWLDITLDNPEIEEYKKVDPMLKPDNLKIIGRIWAGDADASDYRISPMFGDLAGLPKLFMFVGTREICLPDARKFVKMLEHAGADYEYHEYPMMNHVFPLYPIKEGAEARKRLAEILDSES